MRGSTVALMMATVALSVGCAKPASRQPSAELEARGEAWEEAFDARDVEKIVALYASDARVLPPNAPMGQGPEAIRSVFSEMIDSGLEGELDSVEAEAAGDLGYRVGTYELRAPGGTVVDRGKFIETWELADGEWKIANDIWNSDMPAGAAETAMIFTRDVGDSAAWLSAWEGEASRHEVFALHGAPRVELYENPENPNDRALLVHVTDPDRLRAFVESPEGQAAATEDTVRTETIRVYVASR